MIMVIENGNGECEKRVGQQLGQRSEKTKTTNGSSKATKNPAPETGVILKMIEMLTGILHSSFKAYEMRDTH